MTKPTRSRNAAVAAALLFATVPILLRRPPPRRPSPHPRPKSVRRAEVIAQATALNTERKSVAAAALLQSAIGKLPKNAATDRAALLRLLSIHSFKQGRMP